MRVNGHIARVGTGRVWRLGVTVFALLAFALQSYTTQTHMHKPATPGWGAIVAALDLTPPVKDGKTPIKQDQQCPLCQAVAHAGAFLTPAAGAAVAPTLSVQIIAVALDAAIVLTAVSHSWQSRGPPLD